MKYTIFETQGPFDLSALDTFGMNAKPNSDNPIGYFGTGLKNAIAVLLRNGAKIDLYCNGDHYHFYAKEKTFRGKTFKEVMYRRQNLRLTKLRKYVKMGFVTDLGKNWKLWQAFRELYSNTLDENGVCYTREQEEVEDFLQVAMAMKDHTYIVVEHFEFAQLVAIKGEIFLDPQRNTIVDETYANVTDGKSKHLYFRGMRAFDLEYEEGAMFTHNVIAPLELTEDRTIKSIYEARRYITDVVSKSNDEQFIKRVLTAPDKTFEHSLDFSYAYDASDVFKKVVTAIRHMPSLNRSAGYFYSMYVSPPKKSKVDDYQWSLIIGALREADTLTIALLENDPVVDHIRAFYLSAMEKRLDR